jgi:mono/diheme cytochrome c family protein
MLCSLSRKSFVIWLIGCFALVAMLSRPAPRAAAAPPAIDFNRDIKPILSNNCYFCHGPDEAERKGGTDGLRLDTLEGAKADLGGHAAVVPGKPDKSELLRRVLPTAGDEIMPPADTGKQLSPKEIELLTGPTPGPSRRKFLPSRMPRGRRMKSIASCYIGSKKKASSPSPRPIATR